MRILPPRLSPSFGKAATGRLHKRKETVRLAFFIERIGARRYRSEWYGITSPWEGVRVSDGVKGLMELNGLDAQAEVTRVGTQLLVVLDDGAQKARVVGVEMAPPALVPLATLPVVLPSHGVESRSAHQCEQLLGILPEYLAEGPLEPLELMSLARRSQGCAACAPRPRRRGSK